MMENKMPKRLGEVLSDMILYGDLDEAPWPKDFPDINKVDEETRIRFNIAATFLKIMNKGQGGSCTSYDDDLRIFLNVNTYFDKD